MVKKRLLKIICFIFIAILGFYVIFFGFKKARDYQVYKEKEIETKIYTVWHIETFEGGGKARIEYLKTAARLLEKENNGILFMISPIKPEDLSSRIETDKPDIISFGFGIGKTILPLLLELDYTYNARDNLVNSAKYAKGLFAIPYISSGYAFISHAGEIKEYCYGLNSYTYPEKVIKNIENPISVESQYKAYKKFVNNKKTALIGTARDVFRVDNLNKIGRTNALITPIDGYTDLIQYCGITKCDNFTLKFLDLLLSDSMQSSLTNYSLFGVKNNKIYSSGIYNEMENAIFSAQIPNVFYE